MEDDPNILEVMDKSLEWLEVVIKGLDLQSKRPKGKEEGSYEALPLEETCAQLEGVEDILNKKDEVEGPKPISKAFVVSEVIFHKGKTILGMIKATVVMVKALGKILYEMDVKVNREA